MPRKTQEEVIADLERRLEEAKTKAVGRVQTEIEKLKEKIVAIDARIKKLTDQKSELTAQVAKLEANDAASITFSGSNAEQV